MESLKVVKLQPQLIIAMKGHPGTGKTTLARAIAAALRCPLLDKDDVRDGTANLSTAAVAPKLLNDLSYQVLWRVVATQLQLGLSVVVDSPLSRRAHLDRLVELAAEAGAGVVVVECKPSDEGEWRRRLERRGAAEDASWHKPSTWPDIEKLMEGYGGCTEYDVGDVRKIVVDTTADSVSVGEMVSYVMRFINGPLHC